MEGEIVVAPTEQPNDEGTRSDHAIRRDCVHRTYGQTYGIGDDLSFCSSGGPFLDELSDLHSRWVERDELRFPRGFPPRPEHLNPNWKRSVSGSPDPRLVVLAPPPENVHVVMDEEIWKFLPEDILAFVVDCLHTAARARFRCVSWKWARALSSPTGVLGLRPIETRTVKANAQARRVFSYCHLENKWFRVPCKIGNVPGNCASRMTEGSRETLEMMMDETGYEFGGGEEEGDFHWRLVDVDGELFCYLDEWTEVGYLWISVCNPCLQNSVRILPPCFSGEDFLRFVKLIVDSESKIFWVVVVVHQESGYVTLVYDSGELDWVICERTEDVSFDSTPFRYFAWRGALYARTDENQLFGLDMDSGMWNAVRLEFPDRALAESAIISSKDVVMLIELDLRGEEFIRVWKQGQGNADEVQPFSAASWEKQAIELPGAIKALLTDFRECTSHGSEYLCFHGRYTNQWAKYTFSTGIWHVMPSRGRRMANLQWFTWEPGMNIDVSIPEPGMDIDVSATESGMDVDV